MLQTIFLYFSLLSLNYNPNTSVQVLDEYEDRETLSKQEQLNNYYKEVKSIKDSTEIINKLNELRTKSNQNDDKFTEVQALIYLGDYVRSYPTSDFQEVLNYLLNALSIAKQHDLKIQEAEITHKIGTLYFDEKNYPLAFENLLKAQNLIDNIGYENYPNINYYLYNLGRIYYDFTDYNNALKYLSESLKYEFTSAKLKIHTYNTLALVYRNKQNVSKSITYFKEALKFAQEAKDSAWIGIISGNLGQIYLTQNKNDSAIPLLKNDINLSIKSKEYPSAVGALLSLSTLYLNANKMDSVKQLLKAIDTLIIIKNNNITKRDYFRFLAKYHYQNKEYKKAYDCKDSADFLADKIGKLNDKYLLNQAELKINTEKHLSELVLLENEKRKQIIVRNAIILVVILLIIIGFQLIKRMRLKQKKESEILQLELNNSQSKLNLYIESLREKSQLIEEFKTQIEQFQKNTSHIDEKEKEDILERLQNSTILTEEAWIDFRHLFEKAHKNFFTRLKKLHPELTVSETRLLALTKLNLTINEIANMLGISPDSVRKTRLRLRKKLNIEENSELENLVSDL